MGGRTRCHLARLHVKGLLTMKLLFLAEIVTEGNAVTLWNSLDNSPRADDRFYRDTNGCPSPPSKTKKSAADAITSFPAPPPFFERARLLEASASCPSPPPMLPLTRILDRKSLAKRATTVRRYADDCCAECSNCMDPSVATQRCHVLLPPMRGGYQAAHAAAGHDHLVTDGAAAAAAAVTSIVTPYNIPLNVWKVLFQALLTTINVLCWYIPLKSRKISDNKMALSLANAFSGGVFLSLAFGHMIPECIHGFDANWPEVAPFLFVLAGYLLIFFVEKVAFDTHDILHEMHDGDHHHHHHSHANHDPSMGQSKNKSSPVKSESNGVASVPPSAPLVSGRSALILLGALAVHSILEMMALGLADSFGDSALLTLSIALHQPAESIALLVAFLKAGVPEDQIVRFLSIFASMGPIGVALGMAVNEFAAPVVDSIMLAIVAGTFVYVGATEVIPEEWEDHNDRWPKFAALMAGIVSILVITQYTMTLGGGGHEH